MFANGVVPMKSPQQRAPRTAVAKALRAVALATAALSVSAAVSAAAPSFVAFESGQVRPLAQSADGSRLFAVNTPNNTLDVFKVVNGGLELITRVPVGLEPVAVAVRNDNEVWVVNHLSDSVSVVSLSGLPHVTRTLLVGDEPRDIVFAGLPARAFITTAHRGQQRTDPSIKDVPGAGDPKLTTAGIGRADVWVFNPSSLGDAMGGVPVRIMSFFADTPRALAVSPDRNTVYVAAYKSGNETASINEELICNGFDTTKTCTINKKTMPGGLPGPKTNVEGKPAPETGLIVKYDRTKGQWLDVMGRNWNNAMEFTLPDKDVFAVDANALTEKVAFPHVGTVLFNMAVNPVSGVVYVSNTESNNLARFEGPGIFSGGQTVQGKLALTRVTVIANSVVSPRHLNKHIDYSKLVNNPGFDATTKDHSLSMPLDMAVTKDGKTLYVTAFGSSKIGVFSTAELENDSFNPKTASSNYITVSGGGPSGVVLDETRGQMYVMTRFDNSVKVVNLASRAEVAQVALTNPEPANILAGRPFLYDAQRSSANGEASCASCHTFGDMDDIAWDLGDPDGKVTQSPIPGKFTADLSGPKAIYNVKTLINGSDKATDFHPMKGPMTTQTLRGMRNSGAMHWRGDRSNGVFGVSAMDSNLSFKNFAVAFEGLLGNKEPMSEADMQKFADFQLNVQMPPNPIRNLDNSLTASQQRGSNFFFGNRPSDGVKLFIFGKSISDFNNCNGCHTVDPSKGMYGTGGLQSFEGISQILKVPQLRNMYQKVGRFGSPAITNNSFTPTGFLGDQIRGYGFVHDGGTDTLAHFFTARVFQPTLNSGFPLLNPDGMRRDVTDFMHAMTSDLAPIVGQQVTLTSSNATLVKARIDLLIARAKAPFVSKELGGTVTECDLVATVAEAGVRKGYFYDVAAASFVDASGAKRADTAVRALAATPGQEVTYTCTPPGSGPRIAFSS
jgi:DNA-binding beta-propeller fold protein YncE